MSMAIEESDKWFSLSQPHPEERFPHTRQVASGQAGEAKFLSTMRDFGVIIESDVSKREPHDFVIVVDNKRLRVQVKHTISDPPNWIVRAGRAGVYKHYTKDVVDVMMLALDDSYWCIPIEDFRHRLQLNKHSVSLSEANSLFAEFKNNFSFSKCTEYDPQTFLTELINNTES